MDWSALHVSLSLAVLTTLVLLPVGLALARWLAVTAWAGRPVVEALLLLPLLLPPTVIGFYFLVAFGQGSALGAWLAASGIRLVFTLEGLLLVSVLASQRYCVSPSVMSQPEAPRFVVDQKGSRPMKSAFPHSKAK